MGASQWAIVFFALAVFLPTFSLSGTTRRGTKVTIKTPDESWFIAVGLLFLTLALT